MRRRWPCPFHRIADVSTDRIDPIDTPMHGSPRKRVIMIMGVQRSGTTALFDVLAKCPGVSPRHESAGDEIYDDYFLRPEPQIRAVLQSLPGTVLLKPVRESERRSPLQVAEEYRDYDLRIIWLYRDPVNVFHSYVRLGWCEAAEGPAYWLANQWADRNIKALASARQLGNRLLVVRYEDLTSNPAMARTLGTSLGLEVSESFGVDSSAGRRSLPMGLKALIDEHTTLVQMRLNARRAIRSAPEQHAAAAASTGGDAVDNLSATILCTDGYEEVFCTADVGPLYARWRSAGAVHHDASTGDYVALGYEACRAIHAASRPFATDEPCPWDDSMASVRRATELERYFARRRSELRSRMADEVRPAIEKFSADEPTAFLSRLALLSERLAAVWWSLPTADYEGFGRGVRDFAIAPGPADATQAWEAVRGLAEGAGLGAALRDEELLRQGECRELLWETCVPLFALPVIVANTIVALTARHDALERVRSNTELVPRAIHETMRLTPVLLAIKRCMIQPLQLAGLELPAGAAVDLLIGAANRDPAVFPDPDAFLLDRQSPAPFIFESEAVPFCRLNDERRPGCDHLVLDVAAIVVQHLLSGPRPLHFKPDREMRFQVRWDGSCTQMPTWSR